jgi:CBS domain-containing protein
LDALVSAVETCGPNDLIGDVAIRADDNLCLVVNEHGIVLGRLGPKELASPPDSTVEAVMRPGPATVRADEPLNELLDRMAKHRIQAMIVTTPEGRLLGVIRPAEDGSTEALSARATATDEQIPLGGILP